MASMLTAASGGREGPEAESDLKYTWVKPAGTCPGSEAFLLAPEVMAALTENSHFLLGKRDP